jgi:ankyrin repeat protein
MENSEQEFLNAVKQSDTPRMRVLVKEVSSHFLARTLENAIKDINMTSCRFIINETSLTGNERVNGHRLLSSAIHFKNGTALGLLLEKPNIESNFTCARGTTFLEMLARDGYAAALQTVLAKNVYSTEDCKNALRAAVFNNQSETALALLRSGICLNTGYPHNRTPLHWAIHYDYESIARILIDFKANVNQVDSTSQTPLYMCARKKNGNKAIAELLVSRGASIETTYQYAQSIHDNLCIKNLRNWFPDSTSIMPAIE